MFVHDGKTYQYWLSWTTEAVIGGTISHISRSFYTNDIAKAITAFDGKLADKMHGATPKVTHVTLRHRNEKIDDPIVVSEG